MQLMKEYGSTHYGGTFSSAEILINLYDSKLNSDDVFILSKGHSCWIYYLLLRERGHKPKIEGHPHFDPGNGIYCTTGSLGHGLPTSLGLALGKRIMSQNGKIFVLMGDGECQEGTTWESLLLAGKLVLNNLIVIIDSNNIQGTGYVNEILPIIPAVTAAATASGWTVLTIDGHNDDLSQLDFSNATTPILVIANTVKGKGVSFMENIPEWHSKWLDEANTEKALEELK
jgi:transketolase